MSFFTLSYFLREAYKNVKIAPLLTAVSVFTIATALVLVGFFGGLLLAANDIVDGVADDIRVSAYLDDDVSPEQIASVKQLLEAREGVEEVVYIPLEEDRLRNRALLSAELLAGLDDESIPASPTLEIVLERKRRLKRDVEDLAEWANSLSGVTGVSDVQTGMDKIRLGLAFVTVFQTLAWSICIVLLVAAVFFVFSTIKMAVYARADEIEILRLVGATPRFIRTPYYIEGFVQGLAGSIIAFFVVLYLHGQLNAYIREQHLLDIKLDLIPAELIIWFFVGGTLLGLAGSVFSVGRYLKD